MSVSRCYQSHPNNHSTEEPRFLGLPIRGQITIYTSLSRLGKPSAITMVFPPFLRILLHGVSKFIYPFFFKITKNTEATKSCCTQNYRIMQSHDTTCANSPTLPDVQPVIQQYLQTACVEFPSDSRIKIYLTTAAIISIYITADIFCNSITSKCVESLVFNFNLPDKSNCNRKINKYIIYISTTSVCRTFGRLS